MWMINAAAACLIAPRLRRWAASDGLAVDDAAKVRDAIRALHEPHDAVV
jgi:hypothetical protein